MRRSPPSRRRSARGSSRGRSAGASFGGPSALGSSGSLSTPAFVSFGPSARRSIATPTMIAMARATPAQVGPTSRRSARGPASFAMTRVPSHSSPCTDRRTRNVRSAWVPSGTADQRLVYARTVAKKSPCEGHVLVALVSASYRRVIGSTSGASARAGSGTIRAAAATTRPNITESLGSLRLLTSAIGPLSNVPHEPHGEGLRCPSIEARKTPRELRRRDSVRQLAAHESAAVTRATIARSSSVAKGFAR